VVVGTGYGRGQLTPEARCCLERAGRVLAFADAPESLGWLRDLNPTVRLLGGSDEPAREILDALSPAGIVCLAFPGHPCVGTLPLREILGRVRAAGHSARIYPGISWEDCLFAAVGIDPATHGRILFRAEDFPRRSRSVESSALLVLLQGAREAAGLTESVQAFAPGAGEVTAYAPPSPEAPDGAAWRVAVEDLGVPRSAPVTYCLAAG
jgi:hypothetical protein